ncbi:MAG TPA: MerR family transcriptional regulator [Pseudomonadota bacterium]|nr:MerR family transcriptional regulator [Pseudomonadota bacterium]
MSKYRIQTVAQMTGLSAALIRAWEARYGLIVPERTEAGYRLYSDDDVAVLRSALKLVQRGIAPMQLAKLQRHELLAQAAVATGSAEVADGSGQSVLRQQPAVEPRRIATAHSGYSVLDPARSRATAIAPPTSYAERVDQLLEAFATFDNRRVDELLGPPLALLSPQTACKELLLPLLREVGERWHRGELSIAAEHFGSSLIRGKLKAQLELFRQNSGPHRMICACPPGEMHELGLLMFTLDAATQGWDTIYLGANLPLADLKAAIDKVHPELVGLSLVARREPSELRQLLSALMHLCQGRCRLLVGGSGLSGMTSLVRECGALMMPESGQLTDLLRQPN